ncbi:MAG: DUF4173 domain-containing protein, partial [Anaerolineae bacterium]|nr:DUF4173 domain-containing protein [Anaerolineae bacterium]
MKINHKRVFWISLAVGWLFDLLFWGKALGISFPLFVFAAIAAGVWAARKDGVQLHRMSWWLLVPIAFFAVMSAVRLEPFTGFLDRTMALFFMTLLANSFQGGRWPFYRLRDHFLRFASLAGATLSRWTKLIAEGRSEDKNGSRQLKAVLRGLLLAVPVFFLFGGLLASADAVFAEYFEDLLELLQLEDLMEYIRRGIVILIVAMGVFGVFYQAMVSSKDEKLPGERIKLARFLGFTETVMALGTAILLFAAFVGIQFRYFFFGEANIAVNGFTYAEYARRGFFELVVVAVLSLALLFGLSTFAKRESGQQQRIFSGAGIVLVALVAVILVSAFLRLSLYEQAYGFTRLRTYAHVFMIWLGVLLAATAALETLRRSDRFALALLLAATGFTASLNILNVDAFITRANIEHAFAFEAEDTIAPGRF